jgi:hypothetical protein
LTPNTPRDDGDARVSGERLRMSIPAGLRVSIEPSAYSPSYGVKVPCVALNLTSRVTLDGSRSYEFTISA